MTKEELLKLHITEPSECMKNAAKRHWDSISKPLDGLGDFESVLVKLFSILKTDQIDAWKKALVVMIADNGIVEEGVSQCGQENTLLVAKMLGAGKSSASIMASFAKADCIPVDMGIAYEKEIEGVRNYKVSLGTHNFLQGQAMSEKQALDAIEAGLGLVKELKDKGYHLVATGEMGIGNTTTATALLCALTGTDAAAVTGRGAGLSDAGLNKKKEVIQKGLELHKLGEPKADKDYALYALSCVGGLDIAAMTGLFLGGAVYGIPIVIDGLISSVAALTAEMILPGCKEYMIPSHSGREQGIERILEYLGLRALLKGDMAFGEGTGALMLFPVLDMVLDYYHYATRFDDANIEQYERH